MAQEKKQAHIWQRRYTQAGKKNTTHLVLCRPMIRCTNSRNWGRWVTKYSTGRRWLLNPLEVTKWPQSKGPQSPLNQDYLIIRLMAVPLAKILLILHYISSEGVAIRNNDRTYKSLFQFSAIITECTNLCEVSPIFSFIWIFVVWTICPS